MRKILSIILSSAVACLGVISIAAGDARAQEQIASVGKTVSDLKEEYRSLRGIEIAADAPREVRETHSVFLGERRAQLSAALRTRLGAFRRYRSSLSGPLSDKEGQKVDEVIRQLEGDLRELAAEGTGNAPAVAEPPQAYTRARLAPAAEARTIPVAAPAPGDFIAAPAAAIQGFPGTVTITSTSVAGMANVFDKKEITLHITFNAAVNEIRIEVQKDSQNVQGYPKSRRIEPTEIGTGIDETVTLAEGINAISVRAVKPAAPGGVVTLPALFVNPVPAAATPAATPAATAFSLAATRTAEALTREGEYDWGRVRAYFTGGLIFSKDRDEFSKSDLALSFVLDKNYFQHTKKWNLNTFFEARLTAIPVSASSPSPSASPAASPAASPTPVAAANQIDTFITNKKAGFAQAGVYLPINLNGWRNQGRYNSLFVAPLAKGGVQTIVGDRRSAEAVLFGDDDVYNFFSVGMRLGHFRYQRLTKKLCPKESKKNSGKRGDGKNDDGDPATSESDKPPNEDNCDRDENYAPELVSWLDITTGRWENFELDIPTGDLDAGGNAITTRHRRWRYQAEGRLKIPETPFMVGFDGNFGKGPDDLRFGFGVRFDIGRVIRALKIAEIFGNEQAQAQAQANAAPAAAGGRP